MKKENPKQKVEREEIKPSPLNFAKYFIPLIAVVVAIGAYSSDSLFLKIFKSTDIYNVVRVTSMGGTQNTGYFRAYPSAFGELLAPIQMLLYLNIRNQSEFEQIIQGILLEIKDTDNSWKPIKALLVGNGIFSALSENGLKEAMLLDFKEQNLIENLGQKRIKQKDVISGWLFLEFQKKFRNQNVLNKTIRITFYSGFGEQEIHVLAPIDLPKKATQTRIASFKPTLKHDLSSLSILAEEDLFDRFKNQNK